MLDLEIQLLQWGDSSGKGRFSVERVKEKKGISL